MGETHYIVIDGSMTHLGAEPRSIDGSVGEFVGQLYYATFKLPAEYDPAESAIIQSRARYNHGGMKFLLNNHEVEKILGPHYKSRDECVTDFVVLPKNLLKPGTNTIHIGHTSSVPLDGEYFIMDNIVLWYKTNGKANV